MSFFMIICSTFYQVNHLFSFATCSCFYIFLDCVIFYTLYKTAIYLCLEELILFRRWTLSFNPVLVLSQSFVIIQADFFISGSQYLNVCQDLSQKALSQHLDADYLEAKLVSRSFWSKKIYLFQGEMSIDISVFSLCTESLGDNWLRTVSLFATVIWTSEPQWPPELGCQTCA